MVMGYVNFEKDNNFQITLDTLTNEKFNTIILSV